MTITISYIPVNLRLLELLYYRLKSMNFIVQYNQLDGPTVDVLRPSTTNITSTRRKTSLCAATNRNISNIFTSRDKIQNLMADNEEANEFVYN